MPGLDASALRASAVRDGARRIPLFRPIVTDAAAAAVAEVLASGWLGAGPRVRELEERFAEAVGAAHCVAVASGTDAVRLAVHALDLAPGAEVITTPVTFVSVNHALLQEGLKPVFADVDPTTGAIDPDSVAALLTERTGAIVVMHYGGRPCDLDELRAIAADRGVPLVEDAAHACGASYRGRPIGSSGICAFSFGAIKNLAIGAGGAIVVETAELAARLRRLRNVGISVDAYERSRGGHRWDYEVVEVGFRCAPSDVLAAIGLAQLPGLAEGNRRRAELAARYRAGLEGVAGVRLIPDDADRTSAHHLLTVLVEERDALAAHLDAREIETGVYYRPSYDHAPFERRPLPGVETFWRSALQLPLHLGLEDADVDRVVAAVREGL